MSSTHPYLRDLASLTANSASLYLISVILHQGSLPHSGIVNYLIWYTVILLTYLAMAIGLYLRPEGHSIPILAALSMALLIPGTCLLGDTPASLLDWMGTFFLWGIVLYRLCDHLAQEAAPESRLLDFETCVLSLIVGVLLFSGGALELLSLLPPAFGCLASGIGLVLQRSGADGHALRQSLITILLPAVLLGITVSLFLLIAAPVSAGLQTIVSALRHLMMALLRAIYHILYLLMSLFPAARESAILSEMEQTSASLDAGSTTMITAEAALSPFLFVILAAGIFLILTMTRRQAKRKTALKSRKRALPFSLLSALWQRISDLLQDVRFLTFYLTHRNTVSGLFCWIEHRMRRLHLPRRPQESPRAFLTRCAEHCPESRRILIPLLPVFDRSYYDPQSSEELLSPEEIRQTRRQLTFLLKKL